MPVALLDRVDGIYLGMRFTGTYVIPFADYPTVTHNNRTHHRIGRSAAHAATCELQSTRHIKFINRRKLAHL